MLVAYQYTFWSRLHRIVLKKKRVMMNIRCSWGKYYFATFNSALKQATFIDIQREYCLYNQRVQCYQWHLLHPVFFVCYFSRKFTIMSEVSFETPCTLLFQYNIFETSQSFGPHSSTLGGEIDLFAYWVSFTKFNSQQLLFEQFFATVLSLGEIISWIDKLLYFP